MYVYKNSKGETTKYSMDIQPAVNIRCIDHSPAKDTSSRQIAIVIDGSSSDGKHHTPKEQKHLHIEAGVGSIIMRFNGVFE